MSLSSITSSIAGAALRVFHLQIIPSMPDNSKLAASTAALAAATQKLATFQSQLASATQAAATAQAAQASAEAQVTSLTAQVADLTAQLDALPDAATVGTAETQLDATVAQITALETPAAS